MLIDTHAHLYTGDFSDDREAVLDRALKAGVGLVIMPNIDSGSAEEMLKLSRACPGICYPLMGLHPSSVGKDVNMELELVEEWLTKEKFYGIGEVGIDLYWDKTFLVQQEEAFRHQLRLARTMKLPVVIHVRESFHEVWSILEKEQDGSLTGIFHCFSGNAEEARKVIDAGFYLGIGGVVTFKNNSLAGVLEITGPDRVVLETDAPWLSPVPHRGKRNEPGYLVHVADRVASIFGISRENIGEVTTANARRIFNI
jgi:TatD DNase family protein